MIDAWRGLAALAVVVHHVAFIHIGGPAVMVFFVISGYCIAASLDSCQRRGLGFRSYMFRRVRRIYPPYLCALAFWAVTRAVKVWQGGENDLARTPLEWVQNLTLTQWLTLLVNPTDAAPRNPTLFVAVFWSLCYEEQFYLVMGGMMVASVALGLSVRAMVVGLLVLGLCWNAVFPQLATGLFIEYWALFGIGALVFYRLCRTEDRRTRGLIDGSLVAVLACSGVLRWFAGIAWSGPVGATGLHAMFPETRNAFGELFVGALFGLGLVALRPLNDAYRRSWFAAPLTALGTITFSLYLIHQFNLRLIESAVSHGFAVLRVDPPRWLSLIAIIAGHVGLASVFWYFCERPFLNKSLLPAKPPTGPEPVPGPDSTGVPRPGPASIPAALVSPDPSV